MDDLHDLEVLINSRIPLVAISSHEEARVLDMLQPLARRLGKALFCWKVTEGLQRIDLNQPAQRLNAEPTDVLGHIKGSSMAGIYVLTDFHPYLENPVHVRLLKDIALGYEKLARTIIFLSHQVELPGELRKLSAQFDIALPDENTVRASVQEVANDWARDNAGQRVRADPKAFDLLVRNLVGLTKDDVRRLARNAIYNDGAITDNDLPRVIKAKYALLAQDGVLSFHYDTTSFNHVGGLENLKNWLTVRKNVFFGQGKGQTLDPPKGILLLGVQGCGKSLAAKATAGVLGVPLLRIDFGALYNKFHGETERNLREALKTAEVMAPCVLWMDEIEKGLGTSDSDGNISRRVLGTLLTWMAERRTPVFITATANDIEQLPPELLRKGRFDEIFFVDLPSPKIRAQIFAIHLQNRQHKPENFDLDALSRAAEGFSGAEIEQAVVAALYVAHAQRQTLTGELILQELGQTRPLSVLMAEKIQALREWARTRTVPSD